MSITHTKTDLSDELKFLIACCQTEPSNDDINFINSYLPTITNYQSLIAAATRHGILPLVHKTIKSLSQSNYSRSSSSTLFSKLKPLYMTIVQRNMLMTSELLNILKLLRENKIEALTFKGPALSQIAYGDITLRQYSDLDILIRKEDIYKIDTLLKDQSYQHINKLTPYQEKIWIKHAKDIGLYHPKSGVYTEMHWRLMESHYPMQLDLDTIWDNQKTIIINGKEIKTFATEDLLLFLCIHGSKHLYERIEWIKDIDLLIRSHDIDWEEIDKKVSGSGFETMYYLGLHLSYQLFKTELPISVLEHISIARKLTNVTEYILDSWQNENTNNIKDTIQRLRIKLKLLPGFKEKIKHLHIIILKPSYNELWFVELPKSLYWLYYFIRPYLLLKKYFTKQDAYTQ